MRTKPFFETLPVKLMSTEIDERAREAAKLADDISKHKARADEIKKDLAGREKALTTRLYELGAITQSGTENRQVECREEANLVGFTADVVRCDTCEVVASRPMTSDEISEGRQGKLFLRREPGGAN